MADPSLRQLAEDPLDVRYKGFSPSIADATVAALAARAPVLAEAGFSFPLLTLTRSAVEHNIAAMAAYCRHHGVEIAPHGKSTMSPQLHALQLAAGAWGLTAATIHEVAVYRTFAVPRVLLANEIVDPAALRWLAGELARDPDFEFFCQVDSLAGVSLLTEQLRDLSTPRRVGVLVDIGYPGGRTGCRSVPEALRVARAVSTQPALRLAGVTGYEGLLGHDAAPATIEAVTGFVRTLRAAAAAVLEAGIFGPHREKFIVSCGGSAYFDIVTEELTARWSRPEPITVLLRGGSYVTHDDGRYEHTSPFARNPSSSGPLRPALLVWAHVLSIVDDRMAIVGAGRREVPYDADLPRPKHVWRPGEARPAPLTGATVLRVNDHHGYVDTLPGARLEVGDLVGFGISHPCTAFDKWRLVPVLDDDWRVIGCAHTMF